ncbi:hypothetical protein JOY44_15135 [Phormidium sp. CLA17]|uniref:hypothetical protein n=1 Tax=Leptolyngbya sp. Cla-17 TaxID=2803751 RepID=UPI001490CCBF|nr:hypothetical protein [Leptolyngbya sp. Cla-17]MBM0742925.1 hypothetical protein [Leptolyngbya sp. Cla-17]
MSRFSEDDLQLTTFLKRHQPVVPSANPGLEDRLMTAIASTPQPRLTVLSTTRSRTQVQRRILWAVPSAIAAGLVAMVVSQRTFAPASQPSSTEVAELQTFIESTWQESSTEQSVAESDLFPVTEDSTLN